MSIDWTKFYRGLAALQVQIPATQPGEAVSLHELARLMALVSNNRVKADNAHAKVLVLLGSTKRKHAAAEYQLQQQRAQMLIDPSFRQRGTSKVDHRVMVDAMLQLEHKQVMVCKSLLGELESARYAVEATQRTLQLTKETLNACSRAVEAEMNAR